MMKIGKGQVCPISYRCPHADGCYGTKRDRDTVFTCEFVSHDGKIEENAFRNPQDQTGRMRVLME